MNNQNCMKAPVPFGLYLFQIINIFTVTVESEIISTRYFFLFSKLLPHIWLIVHIHQSNVPLITHRIHSYKQSILYFQHNNFYKHHNYTLSMTFYLR